MIILPKNIEAAFNSRSVLILPINDEGREMFDFEIFDGVDISLYTVYL